MPAWMIVITVIVLLLPVALMFMFNGRNEADSRGRRVSRRWRARA